jgi:hypothetical protein
MQKIQYKPTLKISKVEMDVILSIDSTIAERDNIRKYPTVQIKAVKFHESTLGKK